MRTREEIRNVARDLYRTMWNRRDEISDPPPNEVEIMRNAPFLAAKMVLGFEVVRVRDVPGRRFGHGEQIVGRILPEHAQILVSTRFPFDQQRYSLAHELGHHFLHETAVYNRERTLGFVSGTERLSFRRPEQEKEADIFAAEFLMPSKLLIRVFREAFGDPIDGRRATDDLAYELTLGTSKRISRQELVAATGRERSHLVATSCCFQGRVFESLHQYFRVSPSAMAIRLLELKLVF
jgi:Zn-dependent peptidase ImmA (M78 family)